MYAYSTTLNVCMYGYCINMTYTRSKWDGVGLVRSFSYKDFSHGDRFGSCCSTWSH